MGSKCCENCYYAFFSWDELRCGLYGYPTNLEDCCEAWDITPNLIYEQEMMVNDK